MRAAGRGWYYDFTILLDNYLHYSGSLFLEGDTTLNILMEETGLIPEDFSREVILYPNPARDQISLRASMPVLRLEIFDINGRRINFDQPAPGFYEAEIQTGCIPGIYLVRVIFGETTVLRKLLIE